MAAVALPFAVADSLVARGIKPDVPLRGACDPRARTFRHRDLGRPARAGTRLFPTRALRT